MPWSAWLETVRTNNPLPLLAATGVLAAYYLSGVLRMTLGYPPWESPNDERS